MNIYYITNLINNVRFEHIVVAKNIKEALIKRNLKEQDIERICCIGRTKE